MVNRVPDCACSRPNGVVRKAQLSTGTGIGYEALESDETIRESGRGYLVQEGKRKRYRVSVSTENEDGIGGGM